MYLFFKEQKNYKACIMHKLQGLNEKSNWAFVAARVNTKLLPIVNTGQSDRSTTDISL